MRAHRVLFVQRNIANEVALKNAVVFIVGKAQLVLAGIVDIHSVQDGKLGNEGVFCVDRERHAVVARAGAAKAAKCKAARVLGFR